MPVHPVTHRAFLSSFLGIVFHVPVFKPTPQTVFVIRGVWNSFHSLLCTLVLTNAVRVVGFWDDCFADETKDFVFAIVPSTAHGH